MITKKNRAAGIALLLVTMTFYGQHRPDHEKIKALKVAFITERLNLTSGEAQAFWPIYNAHEKQMESFREKERSQIYDKLSDMESFSDKEVADLLEQYVALEEEKQKTNARFLKEIRKVISAKKTFVLLKTEIGFKRRLLKQYHQRKGGEIP